MITVPFISKYQVLNIAALAINGDTLISDKNISVMIAFLRWGMARSVSMYPRAGHTPLLRIHYFRCRVNGGEKLWFEWGFPGGIFLWIVSSAYHR
jgi:hypothetical protein